MRVVKPEGFNGLKNWKVKYYGPSTMDHGLIGHIVNSRRRAEPGKPLGATLGDKKLTKEFIDMVKKE